MSHGQQAVYSKITGYRVAGLNERKIFVAVGCGDASPDHEYVI